MMDKWDKRFMEMANVVSTWSSCYRTGRQVGAVITKNKRILTTGYNGAPEGIRSCVEKGEYYENPVGHPRGTLLRRPCGTECHLSGGETRDFPGRRNPLLYASAVQYLRQNHRQQRHKTYRLSRRIPGRIRNENPERSRHSCRKIRRIISQFSGYKEYP